MLCSNSSLIHRASRRVISGVKFQRKKIRIESSTLNYIIRRFLFTLIRVISMKWWVQNTAAENLKNVRIVPSTNL